MSSIKNIFNFTDLIYIQLLPPSTNGLLPSNLLLSDATNIISVPNASNNK